MRKRIGVTPRGGVRRPLRRFLGYCTWLFGAAACGGGTPQTTEPQSSPSSLTPRLLKEDAPSEPPSPITSASLAAVAAAPTGRPMAPQQAPVVDAGTVSVAAPSEAPSLNQGSDEASTQALLPKGTHVLHIGDSFAGALGLELGKRLSEAGLESTLKYQKATYIPTWAWNRELPQYLRRYQPDLVLVTLGANELQIPDPSKRIPTLRRLVARLEGRPCVWIGIPLWEGAKPELMSTIRANVSPCKFLDSYQLVPALPRAKDGIHPSLSGRAEWADAVITWLKRHQDPASTTGWRWR